jgi:hypothetical protein
MPPRYAYWTIIVDNAPTAFRSGSKEELLPTFNRLKEKHASAVMMWWQNGKLWPSRLDAQEAMRARGEIGRRNDSRQAARPPFRDRERKPARERSAWTPRGEPSAPPPARDADNKLDWKPKGKFTPAPKRADRAERPKPFTRPDFKPSGDDTRSAKPEWKPKGSFSRERKPDAEARGPRREGKPDWKPKGSFDRERKPAGDARGPRREGKPDWKPKGSFDRERKPAGETRGPRPSAKREGGLDWTPKSGYTDKADRPTVEKRKWVPKADYKKSLGIEPKKDSKWRPGGEHRDPKQKYKDAKKAKWTQFKQNIRKRWDAKGGKKRDE